MATALMLLIVASHVATAIDFRVTLDTFRLSTRWRSGATTSSLQHRVRLPGPAGGPVPHADLAER